MAAEREFLYWSHLEAYEECPQKFLWKYGFGVIDLGRGPGKGKLIREKRSEHNALMGNVLSYGIERLYNDELWRHPDKIVPTLTEIVEKEFARKLLSAHIKYDESWTPTSRKKFDESPPKEILLQICRDGILNYLRTMKKNRILGSYAQSEVDLSGVVGKYTKIAGRPDLIVRRDDSGLAIYDGKNSDIPSRYTNPDQLRWYALCYWVAYHSIPDRLAFVYFRYPEGSPPEKMGEPPKPCTIKPEEWTGLVEVPVVKDDLKLLAHRATETRRVMLKEAFDPTPSPKSCQYCDFQKDCSAYAAMKEANARKPKAKTALDIALEESDGFVELGGSDSKAKV